jgi:L-asparagine transporter-like permease
LSGDEINLWCIGDIAMTHSETDRPTKSAAERVVKICLIISTVIGLLVVILKLIRGDGFFHAASSVLPALSVIAVFYWLITAQRRSADRPVGDAVQHANISGEG